MELRKKEKDTKSLTKEERLYYAEMMVEAKRIAGEDNERAVVAVFEKIASPLYYLRSDNGR